MSTSILGNNYNDSMSLKLMKKHTKLLRGNHRCNRCRVSGQMQYALPYLCSECAVEIYEDNEGTKTKKRKVA